MNLPPFFKAKAFWEAIALVIAGVLALLVFFGILPNQYLIGAAAVYVAIEAVLKFFGIVPELRARGLMK